MSSTTPKSQSTSTSPSNTLSESTNQNILEGQSDTNHTEYQNQQAQIVNGTPNTKAPSNNTVDTKPLQTGTNKSNNYSPAAEPDNGGGNTSNETTGQRNAVQKVKSYISHSAFSREGLIAQLEFEKFTHEQAVYSVESNVL